MGAIADARERVEAALARLEAALARRPVVPAEPADGELDRLRRHCSALNAELQQLSRDNQRLRDALAEAIAQMEQAASTVDELLGNR